MFNFVPDSSREWCVVFCNEDNDDQKQFPVIGWYSGVSDQEGEVILPVVLGLGMKPEVVTEMMTDTLFVDWDLIFVTREYWVKTYRQGDMGGGV